MRQATNSDFTRSWHKYWYGNLGLAILGVAFVAAFITQMIAVLTNKINHDLKPNVRSAPPNHLAPQCMLLFVLRADNVYLNTCVNTFHTLVSMPLSPQQQSL